MSTRFGINPRPEFLPFRLLYFSEHAALVPPDCIGRLLSHAPTEPTDGAIKRLRPTSVFAGVTGDRAPWSAIISPREFPARAGESVMIMFALPAPALSANTEKRYRPRRF